MQVEWSTLTHDDLKVLMRDILSSSTAFDQEVHEKILLAMAILRDLSNRHQEDFPLRLKNVKVTLTPSVP